VYIAKNCLWLETGTGGLTDSLEEWRCNTHGGGENLAGGSTPQPSPVNSHLADTAMLGFGLDLTAQSLGLDNTLSYVGFRYMTSDIA